MMKYIHSKKSNFKMESTCSTFEEEYNEIVVREGELSETLKGKYPFSRSVWKSRYMACINQKETHGDLLRSTFLSGGSMHMPFVMYRDSLHVKALDIDNHIVLTDAEVAHNCEGIRLFFELDYRTSKTLLPTIDVVMSHIRLIYETVQECFPDLPDIVMHLAMCHKKRKQKRSDVHIALAWGAHVIFPDVIVTTTVMKLIAQLLDIRLSKFDPVWSNVVDGSSYRSSTATLRPCYSYKMITCPLCVRDDDEKDSSAKRKRKNVYDDLENLFRIELSSTCNCFNGRIVDPSFYSYVGTIRRDGGELEHVLVGTLNILQETSIIPPHMGLFTEGFKRTLDMGDELDIMPRKQEAIMFPSERRAISGFQRRKNIESVSHREFPLGIATIGNVIGRLHENYEHLGIHNVCIDRSKKMFIITVKGKGSRYCPYRGSHHHSNRVYFCILFGKLRVYIHCFDNDCKKTYDSKPITRTLNLTDCIKLEQEFGLPPSAHRPSISPIVTSPQTITTANQNHTNKNKTDVETMRNQWEERRNKFLSTYQKV